MLSIASIFPAFKDLLSRMLAILNLFWNLIFYLSLLRMLFLTSNFVYQSCQELATLHKREKRRLSTHSQGISTPASQTPQFSPHLIPPSLKPPPSPSVRTRNPSPSQSSIIVKYPHQPLKETKNEFHELSEKNCDFDETDPWCQCSCAIS